MTIGKQQDNVNKGEKALKFFVILELYIMWEYREETRIRDKFCDVGLPCFAFEHFDQQSRKLCCAVRHSRKIYEHTRADFLYFLS